jgi:hypothetical protein
MNFEGQALLIAKELFPGEGKKIEHLFIHNEGFRKLCIDYLVSVRNLKIFIEDPRERKTWMKEYINLKCALEKEFLYFLYS